jgi:hypothetical protein
VDSGTSVCPTYLSIIVAFPSVDEQARLFKEPLLAGAPETPFEWFIASRWCELLPFFIAKTDYIILCCDLPDCHYANPLSG